MSFRSQLLVLALLNLPAGADVGGGGNGPHPSSDAPVERLPLGLFYVGEERTVNVVCHNRGTGTVLVDGAETSCECLEPDFSPAPVAGGASENFRFRYRPEREGAMRVNVTFHATHTSVPVTTSVVGYVLSREHCLSARQWLDEGKESGRVIIDLRSPQRFAAVHLKGSLNLSAFALVHDLSRRQQRLVLIDEGFAPSTMAGLAARLRQAGFVDVRFVSDGVAGWIRAGGAVDGAEPASLKAAQITPAELARAQMTDAWEVIMAQEFDVQRRVASSFHRVAVVAADEREYASVEARLGRDESFPIFFLAGGMEALSRFKTQQASVALNSGAVFQTRTHPPPTAANSGCSTCPGRR